MSNLKWNPKDPDGTIGVPGKGYIKSSSFSQEDLNNLINRAKNRGVDVHTFLLKAGLVPAKPQLDMIEQMEDHRSFEKEQVLKEDDINPHAQPRKRRTKAEIEADKGNG